MGVSVSAVTAVLNSRFTLPGAQLMEECDYRFPALRAFLLGETLTRKRFVTEARAGAREE